MNKASRSAMRFVWVSDNKYKPTLEDMNRTMEAQEKVIKILITFAYEKYKNKSV